MAFMTEAGLRERKKQQTRDAIIAAALRLFDQNGYEATTVADIAAAADIAPRTFFGYFPTKEAVVFHDNDVVVDGLRLRLDERADGETAIEALRSWVEDFTRQVDWQDEMELCRRRIVVSTPALREHDRAKMAEFEDVLAAAVARDLDVPADALRPRMIGAAATAAFQTLSDFSDDAPADAAPDPLAVFDEALTFLRGGIEALAAQPRVDG
ncbi:MAG: Transcriptional regulator, AcrR family [uncultured Solirubrobacteraceae bacterium]|uniref:Transcriptional regulator, AcrR family n=1 Tax=uncultured Solirubrobacteraceae bacterium TaxID=1162706 RepID=A0A6J4RW53_9ACTN|nr:MAG: Transcriptional regulator, AcrR family [uncultured Solirubrobacteraceae bacterium]